jgi:hypothetical protein
MIHKKREVVLPKVRERALTLPLPEPPAVLFSKSRAFQIMGQKRYPQSVPQKTLDQSQSLLFTLPFEIRQKIWKMVIGGGVLHIMHLNDGLGHVRCMGSPVKFLIRVSHASWSNHSTSLGDADFTDLQARKQMEAHGILVDINAGFKGLSE